MTEKLSRRRLLASVPAVAAAMTPAAGTALGGLPPGAVGQSGDDPFIAALAKYREVEAVWKASFEPDGVDPRSGWDDYIGECGDVAHDALFAALETKPTTSAGWAALLDLLAMHPYGEGELDWAHEPLCGFAEQEGEWRDAVVGALRSAAEMLRSA